MKQSVDPAATFGATWSWASDRQHLTHALACATVEGGLNTRVMRHHPHEFSDAEHRERPSLRPLGQSDEHAPPPRHAARSRRGVRKQARWCQRRSRPIEQVVERVPIGNIHVGGLVSGHDLQAQAEGPSPPARRRQSRAQGILHELRERDPVSSAARLLAKRST